MTYDAPFYGSLWLCSLKQHLLLYQTMYICDNVSLFMDQLLTFTLFSDHFSHPLVACIFQNIAFSTFQMIAVQIIETTFVFLL